MKIRQKIYDSSEQTNKLIKITNSYHLYKNLENIRNRKPIYINNSNYLLKKSTRQKSQNDLKNYYKIKDNEKFSKILGTIRTKKVEPPMNTEQNKLINNSKESRLLHKNIENQTIEKENENLKKRINCQKPFISARSLDKEFQKRTILEKKRKKNGSKALILPPINKFC